MRQYYQDFRMRFSTQVFTTGWQSLEIGIPMGCAISPILFVLAMDVIARSAERSGRGVTFPGAEELPPIRAFMDDLTILCPNTKAASEILARLEELMDWGRMKFKTRKSRSLVLKRGTLDEFHFLLCGEEIPSIQEQPVKSLGRWYTEELKDTSRIQETEEQIEKCLLAVDKCSLPGKLKLWCLQFGVMPRIMWPLTVYEIGLSYIEAMERKVNSYIKKWLGVPRCLTNVALYSGQTKLTIPVKSLVEEVKLAKARSFMMLRESKDPVVKNFQPEVKSGRKWCAKDAVEEAESRLRHKEIVGATQTGRLGLGWTSTKRWSSASVKEQRDLVGQEMREAEEEKRLATAVSQSQQGSWTKWEAVEPRKLTWSVLWRMEPIRISFLIRSTYDLLPTPVNLSKWYNEPDKCVACGGKGTLQHILSACEVSLGCGMYTWRHDQVLRTIVEAVLKRVTHNNLGGSGPVGNAKTQIDFVKQGAKPKKRPSSSRPCILSSACDWQVRADLDGKGGFPQHVALTSLRPDVVLWSDSGKTVIFGELTVPWEDNIDYAFERKLTRYSELAADCSDRGWKVFSFPFEVGCRGFVSRSLNKWFRELGFSNRESRQACRAASEAAEKGSAWVWTKYVQRSKATSIKT